jgi:hypothetical protein
VETDAKVDGSSTASGAFKPGSGHLGVLCLNGDGHGQGTSYFADVLR